MGIVGADNAEARQGGPEVGIAHALEADGLTARPDGRQEPSGRMGDEDEECARRRLLQRFQERICRAAVHVVSWIDDDDPPSVVM